MEFKNDRITSDPEESRDIVSSAAKPEKTYETKIRVIYDSFIEGEPPVVEIIDLEKLSEEELEVMAKESLEARLELIYRSFER
jgi:hypothetical protein